MVPALANQYLHKGGKFAKAGYVSVWDGGEFNIYDVHTAKIIVSEKYVVIGWQCPRTRLWRIPLQAQVTNPNLHTLLFNGTTGQKYLNSLYNVLLSTAVLEHIVLCHIEPALPSPEKAIHNFYEIPTIELTIHYLHAAAGFPTKPTWIKIICNGNYLFWPLITVTNVHKHFP